MYVDVHIVKEEKKTSKYALMHMCTVEYFYINSKMPILLDGCAALASSNLQTLAYSILGR